MTLTAVNMSLYELPSCHRLNRRRHQRVLLHQVHQIQSDNLPVLMSPVFSSGLQKAMKAAEGHEVTRFGGTCPPPHPTPPFKMSGPQWGTEKCSKIRFAKRFEQDGECLCRRGVLSAPNTHRNSGLGLSVQFLSSTGSAA